MRNQEEFYLILDRVKSLLDNIRLKNLYPNCCIDILINEKEAYRALIICNKCMGEIIVSQPFFAPYRFFKFEIKTIENQELFLWYDDEGDTVDEIKKKKKKGINIASKYG